MNFELLLVKKYKTSYEVIGITYANAMLVEPDCATLRASLLTIEICKKALKDGKKISIAKAQDYSEIIPSDLVIEEVDELKRAKLIAINEISARLHQMLIGISIIDLMDYLNNYISLLNAGYYITDQNREDKYFEIIEASQENEEPAPISDDASFEEQQKFIEQKQKYDSAQFNLQVLEKYLNSYDKLTKIKNISDFLNGVKDRINNAETIDDVHHQIEIYKSNLSNYGMVKL